ncbi:2-polyprenyl-6-methoxyphenol hydroxylase-like FAD-dependent oxidoreductase [Pseudonocardia hierapolitana]|uniref:2-polyprenyl-6-methoxyphenol hydroxylase-like FAD-dependent oxidoreductase n=1 Tax=Pseudonocardia hierapolitana TaxID=1128676 RepID=A0A561SM62_9PSEU|nr:FAD-dependent oxidoreductase [Pseudonocardia hierapolitana]TWF75957.1 2-polyprenyl-6-methoxyphenol hydroxylase-like FAD-dependent oxidoreductase [Pseudonocardia hierapolitana]
MSVVETDVLVVGGGLAGLTTAAFLARHGTRVLLAERHPSTSMHPKARLVNVRSMELYRALGVEDSVRAAGEPNAGFVLADTLAGEHETWVPPPSDEASGGDLSPTTPYSCDQQRIEPILRARAVDLGADVRFSTTATALTDHGDGVTATLDGSGAATVRARYAVAADGAHSPLCTRLAIGRHGEPVEGTAVSVLFRADLEPALRGRRVDALLARAAEAFLFARGNAAERTWQLGTYLRAEWDPQRVGAYVGDVVRAATGLPELQPVIESVQTWTSGAYVADRFRSGRVFLVGDAAHVMPPYGGFGGNTGVQDAHNLAWKLAAVCRGDAPDPLLDTYEAERAPIAELTVAQALLRSRKAPGRPPLPDQIDATTLVLGFCYPSGHASVTGLVEDPAYPSGRPGTRAPHIELVDGRSMLDLFDPTAFTAVRDPGTAGPSHAHRMREVGREQVARRHRNRWAAVYGGRTVLVRPDGVIAASDGWR